MVITEMHVAIFGQYQRTLAIQSPLLGFIRLVNITIGSSGCRPVRLKLRRVKETWSPTALPKS